MENQAGFFRTDTPVRLNTCWANIKKETEVSLRLTIFVLS